MNNAHTLIVDDDQSLADTTADILSISGYPVEVAYNGTQALKKLCSLRFDCILSDVKMPDISGVELYLQVRKYSLYIPFVLMTAYAAPELINQGIEAGILAALTKPLDMPRVLSFLALLDTDTSIIAVDDDFLFCQTLGNELRHRGYHIVSSTDPQHALSHMIAGTQVILVDFALGNNKDLDVWRTIHNQYPHFPIILISRRQYLWQEALATDPDLASFLHLSKPLQTNKLITLIEGIRRQRLQNALNQETAPR